MCVYGRDRCTYGNDAVMVDESKAVLYNIDDLDVLFSCGGGREARIRLDVGSQEAEYDNDEMNYRGVGMEIGFFMAKAK